MHVHIIQSTVILLLIILYTELFGHIVVLLPDIGSHLHTFHIMLRWIIDYHYRRVNISSRTLPSAVRDLNETAQRLSEVRIVVVLAVELLVEALILHR